MSFLAFLYSAISRLIYVYMLAILVYVLMSWFPGAYQSTLGRWLGKICEPYLSFFSRFIPTFAGLDFSPIVAILVLQLAQNGVNLLFTIF